MSQYIGISTALDNSQKDQRTMNSNRLAVFTASLQCTDELKVSDVGDLGHHYHPDNLRIVAKRLLFKAISKFLKKGLVLFVNGS